MCVCVCVIDRNQITKLEKIIFHVHFIFVYKVLYKMLFNKMFYILHVYFFSWKSSEDAFQLP